VALAPGTRLGPYEIGPQIGAGGMGEVYRATDTNLKRSVAIKVLPEALAADEERLARFQREAEVLAALNHQHIAQIHGLEKSAERVALVMELVEGPTLADRIAHGAMPINEVMAIAQQIAQALEAAHEQGIIHRDLKPANVKVRDDGTVKVLDFGLAKVAEPAVTAPSALSQSPTITTPAPFDFRSGRPEQGRGPMTQAGLILGTAAYMSPEQAKGRAADKRSDVWSFGCVLYEMLTGRRAFDGEDTVDTLGAVTRLDPDWTLLPPTTPAVTRMLVRKCLEKDRAKRIASMSAVLFALRDLPESIAIAAAPRVSDPRSLRKRAIPMAVTAVLAAAGAGVLVWTLKPPPPLPVARSRFLLPDVSPSNQQFTATARPMIAISPDGEHIAFAANRRLYVRAMSELGAQAITTASSQTSGIITPVFSPDGRTVAYWDSGALKKISVSGGAPVTLTQTDAVIGMSWGEDSIVYGLGSGGIMRVSATGGTPEQLVRVEKGETASFPQVLPGNRAILFTLGTGTGGVERFDKARIVAEDIDSGMRTVLVDAGSDARYIPTGHLVYALGAALFAVPFDVGRLKTTGDAVPVVEGVRRSVGLNSGTGTGHYAISETGTLVFVPGPRSLSMIEQAVFRFDRKGGTEELKLPPSAFSSIRISPDGQQVAYDIDDGKEASVWVYDMVRNTSPRRLTFRGTNRFPIWSGDGRFVLFQSDREGDLAIYWQRADGTGTAERLTKPEKGVAHIAESWSPRSDLFSFSAVQDKEASLWVFSMKARTASLFGDARSVAPFNSAFSPDGQWLAYTLRGQGANIFVEPVPATGAKYQITTTNGHHPVWLPDGKGLSFRVSNNNQVVVAVDTTAGFSFGNAQPALPGGLPGIVTTGSGSYDITRDGAAFLAVAPSSGAQAAAVDAQEIDIVVNWFEELKRLVPAK
jgi:serine/threonine-protein kinase